MTACLLLKCQLALLTFSFALTADAVSRRVAEVACPVGDCPSTSTCQSLFGTPVCVCPSGQRFVNGICSPSSLENSDWLDWHNNARAAVGSPSIEWDDSLADTAKDTVQRISTTGNCPISRFRQRGVNLAGGAQDLGSPAPNNSVAVLEWAEEGALYSLSQVNNRAGGCSTGDFSDCARYTQLIWSASTLVGCAVARCRSGPQSSRVWACHYKPAGNVVGQFPYSGDTICAKVKCTSGASCDSSSGEAVCKCSEGKVLYEGKCVADKCRGSCSGGRQCNPSNGRCACPKGTVPARSGSSQCVAPQCEGVACPGSSSCFVGSKQSPYCACRKGLYLQGICTSSPSDPLLLTNVALYSPQSSVPPLVIRFVNVGECVNLEGFEYFRYKIIWRAPSSTGGNPDGVTTDACNIVQFWEGRKCTIRALGWLRKSGDITQIARGRFANARSVKCK